MRRCQRDCQEFISVDGVDQDRSGCWTIGLFPPVIVSGGPRTRSPGRRHVARVGPVYEMPVYRPRYCFRVRIRALLTNGDYTSTWKARVIWIYAFPLRSGSHKRDAASTNRPYAHLAKP